MDDYKARKIAKNLGLLFTGTIGVINRAKLTGIIPSVVPLIEKIKQTDFYISAEVERQAVKEAAE